MLPSDALLTHCLPSQLKWGVIPSWSKEPPTGLQHTINAQAEKLFTGEGLWGALRDRKRCVIVAEG